MSTESMSPEAMSPESMSTESVSGERRRGRPPKAQAGATKAALLRAALDLFAERGYEGTSVRAIARAVGLSESVLYAHFENKRAIFEAVLGQLGPVSAIQILDSADPGLAGEDPAGFILTLVDQIAQEWSSPPSRQLISLMTRDGLIHDPALMAGIFNAVGKLAALFDRWIRDGRIPADAGSPQDLAYALMAPVGLARVLWLHNDAKPEEIAAARERSARHAEFFVTAVFGSRAGLLKVAFRVTLDRVYDFDVLVIGSGPGGQKAAIAAAKLERRVAIVERRNMIGGVCLNTGTIPSKTLREAILYLTGLDQREMYGQSYRVKDEITIADLAARTSHVVGREMDVVRSQLSRNRVTILIGTGSFVDPHTVEVVEDSGRVRQASADKIVIATGTKPARPASIEFDERTVMDSDGIVHLERVPRSMVVAGAGVIGIEYASMFAALGTKVTVVEQRDRMLEFCDDEVVEALKFHLRDLAVTFRFGETVSSVEARPDGAIATLLSGKKVPADTVMYSAGRQGMSDVLNLEAAGLTADARGRIKVDEVFRTSVPHIYAVGDIIGFPALAATSMEQGRVAAHHACEEPLHEMERLQPIGIYSIPEISFVGRTEEQLTKDSVPFEVGVSRYRELARGQIIGDSYGVLKLLVSLEDRRLLGVHVFGTGATELVHIGQAVMGCGGTIDYLVDAVFNYPTLAEAYKVAALDAMNKMRQIARFS
jgi:NAD(P) transhydrogenase